MPANEREFHQRPCPSLEKRLPTRGRMAALDSKLDRAEFLAVDLQFLFYGFDVVPNLSNRIGYFFFCFPEEFAPMARQSWRGNIDAISVQL